MSLWISQKDMAELTGIRTGRQGKTREQRQVAWLEAHGIPHFVNEADRPMVATAYIEGRAMEAPKLGWQPGLAR